MSRGLLALSLAGCLYVRTADETHEANTVADALKRHYILPASAYMPGAKALMSNPSAGGTALEIAGVVERADQDRIVAILREIRSVAATRPIIVRFYREEIVTHWKNPQTGGRGASREFVGLLRTATVDY